MQIDKISDAIGLLESNGYMVTRKADRPTFVCPKGHKHKTIEAHDACIYRHSRSTGKTVKQLSKERSLASRQRFENAYRAFASGATKSEVAKQFSVSGSRASQLINRGWWYALREGWATREP